jgi:hypothetical protein
MNERINRFWLFNKHKGHLEITNYTYLNYRKCIGERTPFKINLIDAETVLNWHQQESYSFFYDFEGCEYIIEAYLKESSLINSQNLFIEMPADIPVIKVNTLYFISNWYDFIKANNEMGTLISSEDFKYVLEFTDDAKYLLYSNFKIQ